MATYTGSDKRIGYLFTNGGGGGSASLAGLSDVSLSSPSDGQVLKYDANAQEWVNSNESGGGGGIVNDGTVGVKIDVTIPASGSQTYTYAELGITKKGYYLIGCCSSHAETNGGWKYLGYLSYSGYYTSSYQTSYIKVIDSYYTSITLNESAETITFYNTSSGWGMDYRIEVLPLHPKIEIPKHTYSTTEQIVGTWIDGKPIYEKTISVSNTRIGYKSSVSVQTSIAHGITDLGDVISLKIICPYLGVIAGDTITYNTEGKILAFFRVRSDYIQAEGGIDFYEASPDRVWYFTVQYTKSTT